LFADEFGSTLFFPHRPPIVAIDSLATSINFLSQRMAALMQMMEVKLVEMSRAPALAIALVPLLSLTTSPECFDSTTSMTPVVLSMLAASSIVSMTPSPTHTFLWLCDEEDHEDDARGGGQHDRLIIARVYRVMELEYQPICLANKS